MQAGPCERSSNVKDVVSKRKVIVVSSTSKAFFSNVACWLASRLYLACNARALRWNLCNEIRAQVCCNLVEASFLAFYIQLEPVTQTWRALVKIATVPQNISSSGF